jgi:hypothetical protein
MFNAHELEEGMCQIVDLIVKVWDELVKLSEKTPRLFKIVNNFTLVEFNKLMALAVPTIAHHT